jgi:hypothetical protein
MPNVCYPFSRNDFCHHHFNPMLRNPFKNATAFYGWQLITPDKSFLSAYWFLVFLFSEKITDIPLFGHG